MAAGIAPTAFLSLFVFRFSFLIDVDRRSLGKGDAVGPVEDMVAHGAHTDIPSKLLFSFYLYLSPLCFLLAKCSRTDR